MGRVVEVESVYYNLAWTDHSHKSGVQNKSLDVAAATQGADWFSNFKICVATRSPSSAILSGEADGSRYELRAGNKAANNTFPNSRF